MADDEDVENQGFDEYDAVIRVPKGERLADSRKTEGWSRGFTARTSEKGPEHAEIRIKDPTEEPEPEIVYVYADGADEWEHAHAKTREQEIIEEALQALVTLAVLKAAEWAKPRITGWWDGRVKPYWAEKSDRWREHRAQRKAARARGKDEGNTVNATVVENQDEVTAAVEEYQATITSDEARQHLVELLIAERFAAEKKRLLTNARIENAAVPSELAAAVQSLTPAEAERALGSILSSNPTILGDLARLLSAGEHDGLLELVSPKTFEAMRLTTEAGQSEPRLP